MPRRSADPVAECGPKHGLNSSCILWALQHITGHVLALFEGCQIYRAAVYHSPCHNRFTSSATQPCASCCEKVVASLRQGLSLVFSHTNCGLLQDPLMFQDQPSPTYFQAPEISVICCMSRGAQQGCGKASFSTQRPKAGRHARGPQSGWHEV